MAYQDTEKSTQQAAPVEVYKFTGSFNNYYYTSHDSAVTVDGQVYTPIAISRNGVKLGTQEEKQLAIEVTVPITTQIVFEYAYEQAPPTLELEIIRCHRDNFNDTVTLWKGRVTSFTVEKRICKMRIPSVFSYIFQGAAPIPRYQGPCNHLFTDARCGIAEATVRHTTVINSVVGNVIGVDTIPYTESEVQAGILRVNGEESRMITGLSGTSVTVSYPFASAEVGDTVEIVRGCDHSFTTCKNVYNNGANYGGFPIVPKRNPFTSKI